MKGLKSHRNFFLGLFWLILALNSSYVYASQALFQPGEVLQKHPELISLYQNLHQHPELSLDEKKTALSLRHHLQKLGFQVHHHIGGYGVVALYKNGDGPTVLYRADMDALPLTEETDVPYRSTVRTRVRDKEVGVMHACGHDVHSTILVGTAKMLKELKEAWHGTVVFLAQPAEEVGKGAKAMIEAGVFERFPKPKAILALHVAADLPVGVIGTTSGWSTATVGSAKIVIEGRGGHAALPQFAKNPILTAAKIIGAIETHLPNNDERVMSIGAFHAGTKRNIIPARAEFGLSIRSKGMTTYEQTLASLNTLANEIASARQCLAKVVPSNTITPAGYNDPALTAKAVSLFQTLYSAEALMQLPHSFFGEDFSRYRLASGAPSMMFVLGSIKPETLQSYEAQGLSPPPLHSARYLPDAEGTIQQGVHAMTHLIIHLLNGND